MLVMSCLICTINHTFFNHALNLCRISFQKTDC